jgi:hypothetical protein
MPTLLRGASLLTGTVISPLSMFAQNLSLMLDAVPSAKWLTGGGTKRDVEFADEACAEPNVAYYQLDGTEHAAQIPEGKVDIVEKWIANGEWSKLKDLEI